MLRTISLLELRKKQHNSGIDCKLFQRYKSWYKKSWQASHTYIYIWLDHTGDHCPPINSRHIIHSASTCKIWFIKSELSLEQATLCIIVYAEPQSLQSSAMQTIPILQHGTAL